MAEVHLAELLAAESNVMIHDFESYSNMHRQRTRRLAVAAIDKLSQRSNDALIPYMAVTYFDQFFSRGEIPTVEKFSALTPLLVAASCLTMAWKFRNKGFNLSNFLNENRVSAPFTVEDVLQMEEMIVERLEHPRRILTPLHFIPFFIRILSLPPQTRSPRRIVWELIVKSQCHSAFLEYRPSVIAASAILLVTKYKYPDYRDNFVETIVANANLVSLKDKFLECEQLFDMFYRRNASVRMEHPVKRSKPREPIPIPQQSTAIHVRDRALETGKPTEPSTSEITPVSEDGDNDDGYEKLLDSDEVMDFDPGWTETLVIASVRSGPEETGFGYNLIQKLPHCCFNIMQGCNIL